MLAPHIIAREDGKTLSLLAFALGRSGVPAGAWAAAMDRAGVGTVDDCVCLFKEDGEWLVSYTERGRWSDIGRFRQCHDAIVFLYAHLVRGSSPYDHRVAWEAATGQEFSLMA